MEVPIMRVLVTAASKHGSTTQIAAAIGATLIDSGFPTDVLPVEEVTSLEPYGAVVLGSGVYMGRWVEPARQFIDAFATDLVARPVWLFSSGPVGDPPKPVGEPAEVAGLVEMTRAREHRVFAGNLDKNELGIGERAITAAVRAAEGDYRDWDEIDAWAGTIADALKELVPA
jgi:menaquinone-dependent protoporphyrinogen oxidase